MAHLLSETTIAEYKRAFEIFDKDNNGILDKDDLKALMNYLKFYPKESEMDNILGEFTDGKSNQISFQDFIDVMASRMFDANAENDLLQAFRVFDKEGRGVVNSNNLREALVDVDNEVSSEEMVDLIQGLTDSDGNINYTKLVREFLFN
jgi:calmodulin